MVGCFVLRIKQVVLAIEFNAAIIGGWVEITFKPNRSDIIAPIDPMFEWSVDFPVICRNDFPVLIADDSGSEDQILSA